MTAAPDYVEPAVGWRVWAVVAEGDWIRLRSLFYDTVWHPGLPVQATCLRRRPLWLPWRSKGPRACPDEECGCGIHASRSPRRLFPYLEAGGGRELWRVLGTVSLWGEVVECEHGWRAATAYPAHLFVPDDLVPADVFRGFGRPAADPESIAFELASYRVPVEVFSLQSERLRVLGAH